MVYDGGLDVFLTYPMVALVPSQTGEESSLHPVAQSDARSRGKQSLFSSATDSMVFNWQHVHRCNSGLKINEDTWLKGQVLRLKLDAQTEEIADRLKTVTGESYRREDATLVDLVTGQTSIIKGYRNSNLLPAIARPKRQRMAGELEAFLETQTRKGITVHYWVLTAGDRCCAAEMHDRRTALSRAVTALNRPLREQFDVEVIFKGIEAPVDENGKDSWHVHANVVVLHHRKLSGSEWQRMRAMVHSQLGAWWKDNGELKQLQEVCKYITKLEDLAKIDDETFKDFAESIGGARLYETYNGFRAWRKELADAGERMRKVKERGGDFVWIREKKRTRGAPVASSGTSTGSFMISVTAPVPAFSPELRPCVLVGRYDGDFHKLLGDNPSAMEARAIALERISALDPNSSHLHLISTEELVALKGISQDPPPPDDPVSYTIRREGKPDVNLPANRPPLEPKRKLRPSVSIQRALQLQP